MALIVVAMMLEIMLVTVLPMRCNDDDKYDGDGDCDGNDAADGVVNDDGVDSDGGSDEDGVCDENLCTRWR